MCRWYLLLLGKQKVIWLSAVPTITSTGVGGRYVVKLVCCLSVLSVFIVNSSKTVAL